MLYMKNVSTHYGKIQALHEVNLEVQRGEIVTLIGDNGAGKTTLVKMLIGELQPDQGEVRLGTNLEIAYFDQHRAALDPEATLWDTLADGGGDQVVVRGQPRHVVAYLRDFLFDEGQARQKVKALSGGERNRLLLARLFARPANVLVLDEPTNDLDIDTLELLEELLQDYPGTVFLVSHDRSFLNNVVTSIIAHEGEGLWREYEGSIEDWLLQSQRTLALRSTATPAQPEKTGAAPGASAPAAPARDNKLSYKERRELETLPDLIDALEKEQGTLRKELDDGGLYASDPERATALYQRDAAIEEELMTALSRWEALSARA
ncbi:MAG TPA: hypothetical protein DDX06_16390 [Curvibacter sp.]|nr:hypothetical protein [Curvibacter sp.]